MTVQEDILTIPELAAHLKVHPTTIYRLLREGRVPGFRVGAAWRFRRVEIENWEQSQLAGSNSSSAPRKPTKSRKARK
jgi:excisionase family DNA binding protein